MLDDEKVRALAENVKDLLDLNRRKHETTLKLLRVCLKHLKDRRKIIPNETWNERLELIEALEEMTNAQH